MDSDEDKLYIARIVLLGVTAIPVAVVSYFTQRVIKKHEKQAKRFVLYFSLAFLAFIL